jgi:hypothetical protein
MIGGSRRLSEGATKNWHGGEDEDNPRFQEGMKLAVAQKLAERELETAKAERISAYGKALGSLVAIGTFVLGSVLYAVGGFIANWAGVPSWIGGTGLAVGALVVFTLGFPRHALRGFLKAFTHEKTLMERLQHVTDNANEKQRQLDENIKIIEPVEELRA